MSVRRESIILELEDNASAEALRAAAAFKALDKSIDGLGRNAGRTRAFQGMRRDVDGLGASFDQAGSSIDRFSGRLGLLGTAAMALGPALIPLGAAAIPAITTLTAGMGAAAGAAGVLLLAFQGVGDAVTAVSDYRLAPTADNLAKVREEMEKLGPAGADFVMAIDRATPALRDLQMTAREGIFPGFERGLDTIMTQLPGVRNLVADLSLTVGNLGEASADALVNDADWQEFFAHIGTDGASALENFGRATGNFVAGIANVLEALSGIGGGSGSMLDSARAFREWAENLEHTEGFQEFANYVRESGPQVAEFLAATGKAMTGLIEAAAPWGQVVLPALTAMANLFGAIASSPIGPPLFTAAAAMLAFSKASALTSTAMARMGMGAGAPAGGGAFAMLGAQAATARGSVSTLTRDVRSMGREFGRLGTAQSTATSFMSGTSAAAQRTRASVGAMAAGAAKAGPAVAAIGLLASGNAKKMDLQNAAMLGLAGSMVGPWGAAAGAAVGFTMDLAAANDDLTAAIKSANQAMDSGSLEQMSASVKGLQATLSETTDSDYFGFDVVGSGFMNMIAPISNVKSLMGGLTGETDKAGKKLAELKDTKAGFEDLAVALGANKDSATEMASGADRAQMAMEKLGISSKDVANAQREGGSAWSDMQSKIQAYVAYSDSAAGRTAAVGDAIANLGNDALGAAHSADQLAMALESLLAPNMDLSAAQDAMSSVLNNLKNNIDGTNKSLVGTSDAVIKNRGAIRDGVTAIQDLVTAQGGVESASIGVAQSMAVQRQALIDAGVAAGMSRGQVESYINKLGLTPDVVRTAFEAAGIEGVDAKTVRLTNRFNALPKRLQTDIKTNGIPKSEADITRLKHKYNLTPKQVQTLARLMDNASGPIAAVIAALRAADGQSATTTITTRRITEIQTISIGQQTRPDRHGPLNANGGFHINGAKQFADGGWGMDGRYYSREPQIIPGGANILWGEKETGWEAYISGKPGERERNLEILALAAERLGAEVNPAANGRITAYANGGSRGSGRGAPSAKGWLHMSKMWERAAKTTERALKAHEGQLKRATDRLDYWNNRRDEVKRSVTGSLTRDWLQGGDTDVWSGGLKGGTAAFAQDQWKKQIADSNRLKATVANLRKNGAGDRFIEEILKSEDPLGAAVMFNKQTKAGMRQSQSLFLRATSATSSAANSTSSIFADEQRRTTGEIRHIRGDMKSLQKQLKNQHNQAEATRKKHSAAKAGAKGARARKR